MNCRKHCPNCNSLMIRIGYYRNKTGLYKRYKCQQCGRTIIGKYKLHSYTYTYTHIQRPHGSAYGSKTIRDRCISCEERYDLP